MGEAFTGDNNGAGPAYRSLPTDKISTPAIVRSADAARRACAIAYAVARG
jgi:hypothetical protein